MCKSRFFLSAVLLALVGCQDRSVPHEAILGMWKSNEQLTLQSVYRNDGLTHRSREILADDFFGHQLVEIREDESRTIHPKDDYDSGFEPYEVLEVSADYVRIKAWNSFFQDYNVRTLYLEGDCYYEIFKMFGFRTYFCKQE